MSIFQIVNMNIYCLFNISNNVESCAFFHTLQYCEPLNTPVLWKPVECRRQRGKFSGTAHLHEDSLSTFSCSACFKEYLFSV